MNRLLTSVALAALAVGMADGAQSAVYIGLQTDGFNGGALTTVASGSDFATYSGPAGSWFNIQSVSVTNIADKLASTSLNVLGTAPRTLWVYVSSTDQTGLTELFSGLTSNLLPAGGSVTLSTWVDAANGVFATTTELLSHTFGAIGTATGLGGPPLSEPYSVTGVYEIHSPGHNLQAFADTIIVSAVPEPTTLALLGGWLAGAGLFLRRRVRGQANV